MIVTTLTPRPTSAERFNRSCERFVPNRSGCYILSTYDQVVLYIGLAVDLRRRMNEHLDNPAKTGQTADGRAFWFHWLEWDEINKLERTWLNVHIEHEGRIPVLNKIFSPTAT